MFPDDDDVFDGGKLGLHVAIPYPEFDQPWQEKPGRLLVDAASFLKRHDHHGDLVGFLLTDIATELALKTELSRQRKSVRNGSSERKTDETSFFDVLDTAWNAFAPRLSGLKKSDYLHFHEIRNEIYHRPLGNPPSHDVCVDYLAKAADLLERLLGIKDLPFESVPGTKQHFRQTRSQLELQSRLSAISSRIAQLYEMLDEELEKNLDRVYPPALSRPVESEIGQLLGTFVTLVIRHSAAFMLTSRELSDSEWSIEKMQQRGTVRTAKALDSSLRFLERDLRSTSVESRTFFEQYVVCRPELSPYVEAIIRLVPQLATDSDPNSRPSKADVREKTFRVMGLLVALRSQPVLVKAHAHLEQATTSLRLARDAHKFLEEGIEEHRADMLREATNDLDITQQILEELTDSPD